MAAAAAAVDTPTTASDAQRLAEALLVSEEGALALGRAWARTPAPPSVAGAGSSAARIMQQTLEDVLTSAPVLTLLAQHRFDAAADRERWAVGVQLFSTARAHAADRTYLTVRDDGLPLAARDALAALMRGRAFRSSTEADAPLISSTSTRFTAFAHNAVLAAALTPAARARLAAAYAAALFECCTSSSSTSTSRGAAAGGDRGTGDSGNKERALQRATARALAEAVRGAIETIEARAAIASAAYSPADARALVAQLRTLHAAIERVRNSVDAVSASAATASIDDGGSSVEVR